MNALILSILLALSVVAGCADNSPPPRQPKFQVGSMVITKVGEHKGMVVAAVCYDRSECYYDVRFNGTEIKTDTHIASSDGPIQFAPITLVGWIHEFELEAAK